MDSALVTLLANAGTAGVIIIVIIAGWLVPKWAYAKLEAENRLLRKALDLERERAGEAASTHGVTNQLIGALVDLAGEHRSKGALKAGSGSGEEPGLAWKDLT